MSSIWNPQDRFILSNMTSEKLYAKSPLTTGVSGTSAYIGLEPSATYNETVLFVNTTRSVNNGYLTAINLSEPASAFERLKFYYSDIYSNTCGNVIEENMENKVFSSNNQSRVWLSAPFIYPNNSSILCRSTQFRFSNASTLTAEANFSYQMKSAGTTGDYGDGTTAHLNKGVRVDKIIGINRKEV